MFLNSYHTAKAHIRGGREFPNINGTVTFKEVRNGVMLTAKVKGLPKSKTRCKGRFFGFHIHERKLLYWKYARSICKYPISL